MNVFAASWQRREQLRFVVVGVANTAIGYGCFALLYLLLGSHVHYLVLQLIAHFASVGNSFFWHRRVTFRSGAPWPAEFFRFNLSYLGALVFSLIALPLLVRGCGLNPLWAAAIVTASGVLLSYVLHSRYSFRARDKH